MNLSRANRRRHGIGHGCRARLSPAGTYGTLLCVPTSRSMARSSCRGGQRLLRPRRRRALMIGPRCHRPSARRVDPASFPQAALLRRAAVPLICHCRLVPATHRADYSDCGGLAQWVPGTSPGMTNIGCHHSERRRPLPIEVGEDEEAEPRQEFRGREESGLRSGIDQRTPFGPDLVPVLADREVDVMQAAPALLHLPRQQYLRQASSLRMRAMLRGWAGSSGQSRRSGSSSQPRALRMRTSAGPLRRVRPPGRGAANRSGVCSIDAPFELRSKRRAKLRPWWLRSFRNLKREGARAPFSTRTRH